MVDARHEPRRALLPRSLAQTARADSVGPLLAGAFTTSSPSCHIPAAHAAQRGGTLLAQAGVRHARSPREHADLTNPQDKEEAYVQGQKERSSFSRRRAVAGGGVGAGASRAQRPAADRYGAGSTFVYPLDVAVDRGATRRSRASTSPTARSAAAPGSPRSRRAPSISVRPMPRSPRASRPRASRPSGIDCVQIPWALSGTAVDYNVPGVPQHIQLTGAIVAQIYLGQITNWNDPAIAKLNPGVTFPNLAITPVFRSDGSGDTYKFTDYLSSVSPAFSTKVGVATTVNCPTGVGGKGSSGVAGVDLADERRDRLHRRRLRGPEPLPGGDDPERGREVRCSRASRGIAGGRDGVPDASTGNGNEITSSTRRSRPRARLPDLDLHLHHRPGGDPERDRAAEDDLLGAHRRRQEVRPEADLRADVPERCSSRPRRR